MTESFNLDLKPTTFEEKYEGDLETSTVLSNRLNDLKKEIKVMLPCKVTKVNHDGNYVTAEILDYDADEKGNVQEYPPLTNIPIRQPMDSGSAYVRLPVQVGDIGTVQFFDSSVDDLVTSNVHTYDLTEEWHKLSDNLFTNGFLPKDKTFSFDSNSKIILGGKDGTATFKLSSDNNWIMVGNLQVNGNISATGTITGTTDVIGGGKSLKSHTHPYTDDGNSMNTGSPN
jgi:hypothetical protein